MQLGMIGLGRMGANIVRRLMRAGHECVVFDRDPAPGARLAEEGAEAASDLADFVRALEPPRLRHVRRCAGDIFQPVRRGSRVPGGGLCQGSVSNMCPSDIKKVV